MSINKKKKIVGIFTNFTKAEMPTFKNHMQVKRESSQPASQSVTLSPLSGVQE